MVPESAVIIPLPGATTRMVGNTVTVGVPITPVLSTAITVAVPAAALATPAPAVNTPVTGTMVPMEVSLKE